MKWTSVLLFLLAIPFFCGCETASNDQTPNWPSTIGKVKRAEIAEAEIIGRKNKTGAVRKVKTLGYIPVLIVSYEVEKKPYEARIPISTRKPYVSQEKAQEGLDEWVQLNRGSQEDISVTLYFDPKFPDRPNLDKEIVNIEGIPWERRDSYK
ncbi:hypothetical protein BVX98_05795 [bacterium F11]|nr:hypothetical protein BVX98_05795 [bacterium F11]